MRLIGTYTSDDLSEAAQAALDFYGRRQDLHRDGASFGDDPTSPRKVSTDISLVWLDRSDPDAFQISDQLMRAVAGGLGRYLKERPLFMETVPERSSVALCRCGRSTIQPLCDGTHKTLD